MSKDSFVLYKQWKKQIALLNTEQKALLLDAIFLCADGEEADVEDPAVEMLMSVISSQMAADDAKYEETCRKRAEGGRTKASLSTLKVPKAPLSTPDNDNENVNDNDLEKKKVPTEPKKKSDQRFTPPTAEEVKEYCREKDLNSVDPQQFVDFYVSKGWKVGNQPMKDWRAATRTWNSRQKSPPVSKNQFLQFEQHDYDMAELTRRAKRRM